MKLATLVLALLGSAGAFSVAPEAKQSSTMLFESRRGFMAASVGAIGFLASAPAFAVDDLAMPSAEEEEAQRKAEMEARLKLKAELKAKQGSPKSFQESMKKELEKKEKDKQMTQEERRNALCEDLGRGC